MPSAALLAYRIISPLQPIALRVLASGMPKLRTFATVRANLFPELEKRLQSLPKPSCRLWVHASSTGEFEQARPLIAALREQNPGMDVVISFLSDSGFEARKNYPDASAVFYLPLDTPKNARRLTALLQADIFLLMRYDFWPNHLAAIRKSGAKMVLAAATLPSDSAYFRKGLKAAYRKLFSLFDIIFTIRDKDRTTFRETFGCQNVIRAGDPRFDQVFKRQQNPDERASKLKPLFRSNRVIVGGSTWEPDEAILVPAWLALRKEYNFSLVLVPHKVDSANITRLIQFLRQQNIEAVTISSLRDNFDPEKQVLVVDQTGYLAELYAIATIAYIGGGFGVNVHNTIEAAVHGVPVIFGPKHKKSPEAAGLLEAGAALVVNSESELRESLTCLMEAPGYLRRAGHIAAMFIRTRLGATSTIANALTELCRTKS